MKDQPLYFIHELVTAKSNPREAERLLQTMNRLWVMLKTNKLSWVRDFIKKYQGLEKIIDVFIAQNMLRG